MKIQTHELGYSIGGRELFGHLDLTLQPGFVTALVGPSGCGKTTLLHCLGLLQRPTAGRVEVDGDDTTTWSDAQRRRFWRNAAAFVLQDYGLVEEESVAYNVSMSKAIFSGRVLGDPQRIASALSLAGLAGREADRPISLSGGEKQRLAIARAIYKNASVVYVDEPTASLDAANRSNVSALLRELAHQERAVVVATHDESLIAAADLRVDVGQRSGFEPNRCEANTAVFVGELAPGIVN